ncbi:hypothetical protein ACFVTJ_10180, partial [Agrobacterium sp. NPDC058088]|uniref:hypothetical protein n=1 Tax=Agrobacterium sp. NPDC058088 TaxID=3346335 RepID=UPI0036D78A6B
NLKAAGSNPAPATKSNLNVRPFISLNRKLLRASVEELFAFLIPVQRASKTRLKISVLLLCLKRLHHLTFGFVVFAAARVQEEMPHWQFRLSGIVTLLYSSIFVRMSVSDEVIASISLAGALRGEEACPLIFAGC